MYTAGEFVFYRRSHGSLVPPIRSFHARWKANYSPVKGDSPLWCSFVNVVNCGKGEGAHAPAHRTGKFLLQYGAAHSHAQEPTFGPRSNFGGKWCGRTAPWFRGPTLPVLGHGGGGGHQQTPPFPPSTRCPPHPLHSHDPRSKGDKIRSRCRTLAFSRARKRAEMLSHPYILRDPQTKGDKIRSGGLTPAFSKAQKTAEILFQPCILGGLLTNAEKIRSGHLTPAFSGARERAEMLRHPCILGGPQTKAEKLRTGCLILAVSGPKKGRKCYVTPAFSGISKQRRTKSEVLASPLPSQAPKRGR